MNEELEFLINMAIADGEVTDKERAIILRKAEALGLDIDEIEIIINGKLHQFKNTKSVESKEKSGNIKTCPSCGSHLKTFQLKCEDCGHEFRNTQNTFKLLEFQKNLNSIVEEERKKIDRTPGEGFWGYDKLIIAESLAQNAIYERQALYISTFPVPNNNEDLMEFLSMAMGEATKPQPNLIGMGAAHKDYPKVILNNAWKSKAQQIIMKSKIIFKNDPQNLHIIQEHEIYLNKISKTSNNNGCLGFLNPVALLLNFANGIQNKFPKK